MNCRRFQSILVALFQRRQYWNGQTRTASEQSLRRSWSRSRLNPRKGEEEEVIAVLDPSDEVESKPDWSPFSLPPLR